MSEKTDLNRGSSDLEVREQLGKRIDDYIKQFRGDLANMQGEVINEDVELLEDLDEKNAKGQLKDVLSPRWKAILDYAVENLPEAQRLKAIEIIGQSVGQAGDKKDGSPATYAEVLDKVSEVSSVEGTAPLETEAMWSISAVRNIADLIDALVGNNNLNQIAKWRLEKRLAEKNFQGALSKKEFIKHHSTRSWLIYAIGRILHDYDNIPDEERRVLPSIDYLDGE